MSKNNLWLSRCFEGAIFAAYIFLLIVRFDGAMTVVKGIVMAAILIFASKKDIKTREVSNSVTLLLLITALIDIRLENIPSMLLGAFLVSVPMLLVSIFSARSFGGADIKISFACGFILGAQKGFAGMVASLLSAVIVNAILNVVKRKAIKESFAMIPFLSFGFASAFLI